MLVRFSFEPLYSPNDTSQHLSTNDTSQHLSTSDTSQHLSTNDTSQNLSTSDTSQHLSTNDTSQHQSTTDTSQHQSTTDTSQHLSTNDTSQHLSAAAPVSSMLRSVVAGSCCWVINYHSSQHLVQLSFTQCTRGQCTLQHRLCLPPSPVYARTPQHQKAYCC